MKCYRYVKNGEEKFITDATEVFQIDTIKLMRQEPIPNNPDYWRNVTRRYSQNVIDYFISELHSEIYSKMMDIKFLEKGE